MAEKIRFGHGSERDFYVKNDAEGGEIGDNDEKMNILLAYFKKK